MNESGHGTTNKTVLYAIPAFMAVGLYFAVQLLMVKLNSAFTVNFTADCNIGGNFDCSAVQSSQYSTVLGIPIALWALSPVVRTSVIDTCIDDSNAPTPLAK